MSVALFFGTKKDVFENCTNCPLRSSWTKAKEGNHRKLMVNENWEEQKEYVRTKLSEEQTGAI